MTQCTSKRSPDFSQTGRKAAGLLAALGATLTLITQSACAQTWTKPFNSSSIWNTPISSNAQYMNLGGNSFNDRWWPTFDRHHLFKLSDYGPLTDTVMRDFAGNYLYTFPFPFNYVHTQVSPGNNIAILLHPNGNDIAEITYLERPEVGSELRGWSGTRGTAELPFGKLNGDGIYYGAQGGSSISALGGALRRGEFMGSTPITHALKLLISQLPLPKGEGLVTNHAQHDCYNRPTDAHR